MEHRATKLFRKRFVGTAEEMAEYLFKWCKWIPFLVVVHFQFYADLALLFIASVNKFTMRR